MKQAEIYYVSKVLDWKKAVEIAKEMCPKGMKIWSEAGKERYRRLLYKKYPTIMHEYNLKADIGHLENYWGFVFYN